MHIFVYSNHLFSHVFLLLFRFGVALTRLSRNTPEGVSWSRILTIQLLEELMEVFSKFSDTLHHHASCLEYVDSIFFCNT